MDYRAYHAVDAFVLRHHWVGQVANDVQSVLVVLIAVGAFAFWLLARPGGSRRWKLASASALASAGLALLANQVIAKAWHRNRPYQAHPAVYHPYAHSHDPSFPSDHASAAFAIGFAVLFFDRLAGTLFLAAAVLVAAGRVLIGAHYPGDVLAGAFVGLGAALLVVRVAGPILAWLVRLVERVTDPLLAPIWRLRTRS